jgi:hypothetical protein
MSGSGEVTGRITCLSTRSEVQLVSGSFDGEIVNRAPATVLVEVRSGLSLGGQFVFSSSCFARIKCGQRAFCL